MSKLDLSRREFIKVAGAGFAIAGLGNLPLLSGCGGGNGLKVGLMSPATGAAREKGIPARNGFLDGFNFINKERGGVYGYPIKPIYRDSAYNTQNVVKFVNEFMDQGCLFFVTHSSTEMNAAMSIANQAAFPGIASFASQTNYHPPLHIYGQLPDYGDDFVAFAKYYKENIWRGTGKPRIVLHLLNNATGKGAEYGARAKADELGVEVIWPPEEHPSTIQSAVESLTRIRALNPDAMFISSTPQPTSVILKDAAAMGLIPQMTVGCAHASFTKALIDLAGHAVVEGVYGVYPTTTWDDDALGVVKATEYCQKYNPADYGNMDYLSTWATALIVAEIFRLAIDGAGYEALTKGDASSWRILEKEGIQKLRGYDAEGVQGAVSYASGDNRLSKMLRIYRITDGKITMIKDWAEAPTIKYEDLEWFPKS